MKKAKPFKLTGLFYRFKALLRQKRMNKFNSVKEYSATINTYAGQKLLSVNDGNSYIYNAILSGKPFLAGRFGSTQMKV